MHKRNQHKNARLTPRVRQEMVARLGQGVNKSQAGRIYGIHGNTVAKWVKEVLMSSHLGGGIARTPRELRVI